MSMALVMSQMPDVWRKVLAEHLDDGVGRCRACRNANGETAAWPCQTYRVAQEAKWVAEGNLPGTGPHGYGGPSATPRLSPLDEPRSRHGGDDRRGSTGGFDLPPSSGFGLPPSSEYDLPRSDGFDLPGSRGYEAPVAGGHRRPEPEDDRPRTGRWDLPGTGSHQRPDAGDPLGGGYDPYPPPFERPVHDDAATAFGGGAGASSPALASLPPLPPTSSPAAPEPAWAPMPTWGSLPSAPSSGWDRDPLDGGGRGELPQRRPAFDESAPYGSTVDAPYGSTFGVDDRPRGSWR